MATKRSRSPEQGHSSTSTKESTKYFKSGPIDDRNSTFVGLFSPTSSAKELQKLPEFKTASHRMAAWRKTSAQRTLSAGSRPAAGSLYVTGSDDDGEKYGGKRLEKVLNEQNVEGSVMVARWYGGVLLGPVRFTHIENAARDAILLWKNSCQDASKKQKLGDSSLTDAEEKEDLVKNLVERDQSIVVLRQLLMERSLTAKHSDAASDVKSSPTASSPSSPPDYMKVSLQRLRQLDKARDATIAWILKQIDAAETRRDGKGNEKGSSPKT